MEALLLSEPPGAGALAWWGRVVLLVALGVWGGLLIGHGIDAFAPSRGFLHLTYLPFHEAGHLIFRPFGRLVTSLGGTFGQFLMPSICAGVLLLKTRDPFGASVASWWLGGSLIDIGPYVADARAGTLPLLGGNTGQTSPYGFHDWNYILTELGLLGQDHHLAWVAHLAGSVTILAALAWATLLLWRYRP
jgi:hypothetical protein